MKADMMCNPIINIEIKRLSNQYFYIPFTCLLFTSLHITCMGHILSNRIKTDLVLKLFKSVYCNIATTYV